ncbi:RusA family crossover junction endodeoxyribonuclease [Caulobacter sp. Root1472]|uniref:RusA family crossover junction endodeoxyribonuclease n=1 Tax=Caulobacter sp. Root1472 TaxID=1736470 RepID=UPI000AF06F6C|nr:RusA family crossover junction endodeoxyribonuclease [Caulobacter sp. Root1472]
MSLGPELPFEFAVRVTAISLQGSGASKAAWKDAIREAARKALPEGSWLLTEPLAVTIFIFPGAVMQGDVDNRVKPILDAMVRCVYSDDEIVERVVVQKFEPGRVFAFQSPTDTLVSALEADEPIIYIRVTNDLHEELA